MKFIRYEDKSGTVKYGISSDGGASYEEFDGDIFTKFATGEPFEGNGKEADIARLLAPCDPPFFFCIGLNYHDHAKEVGATAPERPVIVGKSPNAVCASGDKVKIPPATSQADYECELVIVIGRDCKDVSSSEAMSYVFGYTACNDITARDWQFEYGGGQWVRGKIFDDFAPLGPCIADKEEIPDPSALALRTVINGELMQDANTSDMIFGVGELVSFLSQGTTLYAGTVIATGTPAGIGISKDPKRFLKAGDTCVIELEGVGKLVNEII